MKVGLISDTHGFFDPRIPELLAGVEHILHAGDIGSGQILMQLERIAPVTAVLGNNDYGIAGLDCRETEVVELGGRKFLVHHIVNPRFHTDRVRALLKQHQPDFVVFGHTHEFFDAVLEGRRFVNPGYAGRPRFNLPRLLATLDLSDPAAPVGKVAL